MGQVYHPYDPDQALLLPPSLQDWLPEDHLAHFVADTVEELDLRPFTERFEAREDGRGQLAYHPALMLKVLIYAYCSGIFSSRRIAVALQESVALRFLAAGNFPSHRTIARFRLEHLERFLDIFVRVVQIATEAGLVKMGQLAVDGSKVKANASKHKAMSYGRMKEEEKRLRQELRDIVERARGVDEAEDAQFGPDFRGDELPEELRRRKERRQRIQEAKKRLEEAQEREDAETGRAAPAEPGRRGRKPRRARGVPEERAQVNFTDPDSRIMKTGSKAFEQCYNGQVAVDAHAQIIVAADVTNCAADNGQLVPLVEAAVRNVQTEPKTVLADSGYKSEANFQALEEMKIEPIVALGRGETMPEAVADEKPATQRMRRRLATKRGRAKYKRRKAIVEPVFGWIKQVLGFRSFLLRGREKVRAEWALVCLAVNLRRMAARRT